MDRHARVALILTEFESAELFHNHDDAFDKFNEIIDIVEDIHSPDSYDPAGRSLNRIYGPSKKYASATEFPGLIEYGHVGHITRIFENGACLILDRRGAILLDKPGSDGRFCPR